MLSLLRISSELYASCIYIQHHTTSHWQTASCTLGKVVSSRDKIFVLPPSSSFPIPNFPLPFSLSLCVSLALASRSRTLRMAGHVEGAGGGGEMEESAPNRRAAVRGGARNRKRAQACVRVYVRACMCVWVCISVCVYHVLYTCPGLLVTRLTLSYPPLLY